MSLMALGSRLFLLLLLCYAAFRPAYCWKFRGTSSGGRPVDWQALYMNASLDELLVYLEEASA